MVLRARVARCLTGMPLAVALLLSLPLPAPAAHAVTSAVPSPWRAPLAPPLTVTRSFSAPPTRYGIGHRGVDIAGASGTAVVAAAAGVVSYAGLLAGRGVVTVVHHGGLRTTYEPLIASVRVGQSVAAGQQLGTLAAGHPGCPVAACLHWGLVRGQDYLDPLWVLGGGPVRLLPFWNVPGSASNAMQPNGMLLPVRPRAVEPTATPPASAVAPRQLPRQGSASTWSSAAQVLGAGGGTGALLLVAGLVAGRRRHRRRPLSRQR